MRQFAVIALLMPAVLMGCRQDSGKEAKTPSALVSSRSNKPGSTINADGTIQSSKDDRDFTTSRAEVYKAYYPLEFDCAKDLCQPIFDKYPSIIKAVEAAKKPTADQKAYFDQYIQPALIEYNTVSKEQSRQWLKAIQNQEAQFKNTELSEDQIRIIQTISSMQKIKDTPELLNYWQKRLVQVPFYRANLIFQQMGKWTYLQEMYPTLSMEEAARSELKIVNQLLKRFAEVIRGADPVDPMISSKIEAGQTLDIEEVEAFTSYAGSIRLLDHFLFGEGASIITKLMKKQPLTSAQLYAIYDKGTIKKDLEKKLQTDLKNNCSEKYFQSINLYPQQAQLEKYKTLAEQTRETALAQLNPQDPAYEKVKQIKILYPPTASANSTAWLRSLKSEIGRMKADTANLSQIDIQSLYSVVLLRSISGSTADQKDLCPRIPDSEISDKNMVAFGYVMVSWYSTRYPEVGASILAHEMGHTVFEYSNAIDSAKACLIGKQTSETFANEDFADLFSAKVGSELSRKYQIGPANVGCNLMEHLSLLQQTDKDDNHSTTLFRALQFATATGQTIPQSCQDLVSRDNANVLKSCH
ncbi:hypothetical protein B9G69_003690 [Bdellovibrio sp. SKB1291214]|uniref:hypothetical protein n=1 Tax=Bdellovibrio sp. SKB1291214 TaxID=1732569 RepID=UPI000B517326|nr:hypothetical protein [Bdellovibrio sp. SKB1291214]UYL09675.1 hypothetical protein B9G69_003690 [Bdellovibrio sp. SKB1291214]